MRSGPVGEAGLGDGLEVAVPATATSSPTTTAWQTPVTLMHSPFDRNSPQVPSNQMPMYQSSWYINQVSQDRYGTDVPTLLDEVDRLNRKLKHRSEDGLRKDRDISELRRRYEKLKASYRTVFDAYDRAVEDLKREKRRWRHVTY
ncbi:hypothetical protein LTR65_000374 [Meristemomyces frigidus]